MKRLWKNRGGFTLVEIIVTFTLTAIFMSSAALVLSTFMRSHTVASAVATEQDVASIVMDTITGSLGAANYYNANTFTSESGSFHLPSGESVTQPSADEGCSLLIRENGGDSEVWYVDGETNNVVRMYLQKTGTGASATEGYLALDYYVRPEPGKETDPWTKVPWQLGTGVYQNCSIESFQVNVIQSNSSPAKDSNCLSITLKLNNKIAGDDHSFTLRRAVECYNLAPENITKM